jgi:hypothetical protein
MLLFFRPIIFFMLDFNRLPNFFVRVFQVILILVIRTPVLVLKLLKGISMMLLVMVFFLDRLSSSCRLLFLVMVVSLLGRCPV